MQEITGTIAIGYGKFRTPDWIDGIKMLPGVQKTYEWIVMSARGEDHAYPSQKWLAKKVKVCERSIRNHKKTLIDLQLIKQEIERIKGRLRRVYYLLAHPAIVAAIQRKNLPVTAENFSGQLDKGKCCTENPPCPPLGKAAQAAGEKHEHTQTNGAPAIEFNGTPSVEGMGEENLSRSRRTNGNGPGDTERCECERLIQAGSDVPRHPAIREAIDDLKKRAVEVSPVLIHLLLTAASQIEDGKLRIEAETGFFARIIEEHSDELAESLKKSGITSFRIGVMPADVLTMKRREDERLECLKRAQEQAIQREKLKELQRQQQRQDEERKRELAALSPEEQFTVLVAAYPRQSVYGDYFAKRTFFRLHRRKELPELAALLRIINSHKTSVDWNRDQGRWIPGLNKWLRAKPWEQRDDRRGQTESSIF